MLKFKELNRSIVTITAILMLSLGTGISFAQDDPNTVITAVDAATGRVVEASKFPSEMTEEEKAQYSVEDLKILEVHEAEMKKNAEMPKY